MVHPDIETMKQGLLDTARLLTSGLAQLTMARERGGLEFLDRNNSDVLRKEQPSLLGPEVLETLYQKQKQDEKLNKLLKRKSSSNKQQFFRGREESRQSFSSRQSATGQYNQRGTRGGRWQQQSRPYFKQTRDTQTKGLPNQTVQVSHLQ